MVIVCRRSGPVAPNQADADGPRLLRTGQPDSANVLLAFAQPQIALGDARRLAVARQGDLAACVRRRTVAGRRR